ncbi:hypothetical protein Poli38472_000938 [Pythium oligandrum]|uniref:Uncharacterized protein n=1 Tax=Pythium oligandrum TaxID=41045 RepID=A0A8K1CDH9_PYTOL|nr:hypothetical protein Poli38472_000938 [Pythium oligandrum]|eukprot:TMW60896.1 hypothetical protein Poli38472_000938 [Pythium oligandrum]
MSERRGPHDAVVRDARAISAKTEDAWMRRQDETESTRPGESTAEICVNRDEVGPENWRKELGRGVVQLQQAVDANLSLFRVGCVLVMAGSAYAAISLSGLLHRFNHIDEIPAYYFRQRKTLRVRMVRQCERDPSVFYVYHTPFWRRTLLQDTLPTDAWSTDRSQPLLAVRAFGIQVDESANEWLWSNVVSSHRYMSLRLLHRMNAEMEGEESLATCDVSIRKLPLDKDLAHELVSRGLAECIPETMSKYDDGSDASISSLMQRLQQLEATQRRAQTMQYGIWKDWQDEKLSDRMVSAGKRVTTRGFKKLMSKLSGED